MIKKQRKAVVQIIPVTVALRLFKRPVGGKGAGKLPLSPSSHLNDCEIFTKRSFAVLNA